MMLFDDCMSPGVVSSVLHPAAAKFLKARAGADPLSALLFSDAPRDEAEAYFIQDQLARAMVPDQGAVCGWKVGAPAPEAEPFAAPIHHATLFDGDTQLPRGLCKHFGVEAELVYRFHRDLLARERPWTLNEVLDAIGSIHTAIEIIDTRFEQPNTQPRLAHLADQASHGALVIGRGSESWRRLSPVCETVRLALSDGRVIEHIGGNSAGDPRRLLVWLANHAAARGLPILAGHSVTTGSMTDTIFVRPGTTATAQIAHLPPVTLTIPDA